MDSGREKREKRERISPKRGRVLLVGRVPFIPGSNKEDECGGRRTASRCYPKVGSNRICGHMELSLRIMKRLVL